MNEEHVVIDVPVSPYLKLLIKLSSEQLREMWGALPEHESLKDFPLPEDDEIYAEDGTLLDAEKIAQTLADKLSELRVPHVEVVLACASLPDGKIAEALMEKPIHNGPKASGRAAGTPSAPKGERAPRQAISDSRIIHSIKPNPKKVGSNAHTKYALYAEGMSVADFIKAGGTMGDVKWDSERGFIQLKDPE
jgi:hypothetical protein